MNYNEAIHKYFKMKVKYEKKVKTDPDSNTCIVCQRKNGMIFSFQDNIYSLQCGNLNDPCSLDVRIRRGIYSSIPNLIEDKIKEQQMIRDEIIEIKVKYLFKELSETDMVNQFENANAKWKTLSKEIRALQRQLIEKEDQKKEDLQQIERQIQTNVENIKTIIQEYKNTKDMEYIHSAVQQYKEEIVPLHEQLKELKSIQFTKVDNEVQQDKLYFSNNNDMIIVSKPEVLSFNIESKVKKKNVLKAPKVRKVTSKYVIPIPENIELPVDDLETDTTSSSFIASIDDKLETLYDDSIVFRFNSKSVSKPYPGEGKDEKMVKEKRNEYTELSKIEHWRRKLSNYHISPFTLHNKRWYSVEHYYQGSKFKKGNPGVYHLFSLDSDSELSKDVYMARSYGTTGKHKNRIIRKKGISVDSDFLNKEEMYRAQYAKFTQNEDLKDILKKTKEAMLLCVNKRSDKQEVYTNLMLIRTLI